MVGSIGITQPIPQAPVLSVPANQNTASATATDSAPAPVTPVDQVTVSNAIPQSVGQPKVQYANPEVLGTQAVTMYMVNGQLYTRYRDEDTGKVTYVPNEAQVLSGSLGNTGQPTLNITA